MKLTIKCKNRVVYRYKTLPQKCPFFYRSPYAGAGFGLLQFKCSLFFGIPAWPFCRMKEKRGLQFKLALFPGGELFTFHSLSTFTCSKFYSWLTGLLMVSAMMLINYRL
ncbi:hypothetical protein, partial [Escherichia coli]|uniref:hypothetical protein n=1 Tax=Escherichia coli TaxID=562 RepID=UPI001BC8C2F5